MNSNATRARRCGVLDASRCRPPTAARIVAGPERIAARAAERVPVDDGEAQVLRHRLAFDLLAGVVLAEGQRVLRLRAFVGDLARLRERRAWRRRVSSGGGECVVTVYSVFST